MNRLLHLIGSVSVALALAACAGGTDVDDPVEAAPKVVSTDPADGATGLKGSSLPVVITMDQNVKVTSAGAARITADGGCSVVSVNAFGKDVTIKLEGLENGGSYKVTVPEGVIEGFKEDQPGAAAVTVRFTMEYVEPERHYDRNPAASLTHPSPMAQAAKLYSLLLDNYGKKTLSGAMGGTAWETSYADFVAEAAGSYPAIV